MRAEVVYAQQVELAYLRSIRVGLLAVLAQIDARIQTMAGTPPAAGQERCPRCDSDELLPAGDVKVCPCGANVKNGEVVDG